jgi:hypothetical protein
MPKTANEVLTMIMKDMKDDAAYYEGKPFTGKNVAEYFGKQGAAISALAKILQAVINEHR